MIDFFVYLIAFFITVPPILTVVVYIISLKRFKSPKRAIHTTVNWTTIFYIIAADLLFKIIFNIEMMGIIITLLLVLLAVIIFYQWRTTEIQIRKATRLLWRIAFLLFFFLFLLLMIIGMIKQITG